MENKPDRPGKPHHLVTVLALAAAAGLLGAWELAITRLASVLYFFDLTYLALAVCLFALGAGALWTRRYGSRLRLAASTLAWHRMTNPKERVHLYASEVAGRRPWQR